MLAPKRPVSVKHAVGAVLPVYVLPGQSLQWVVLQRREDPPPCFCVVRSPVEKVK